MGNAENVLQSSKKRAAVRKFTRDTLIDNEEDDADLEAGTFNKASEEVLPEKAKNEETKQPESKALEVEDKSTSNNDVADIKNAGKELAQTQTPKQDTYILPPVNYHSLLAPASLRR
ncbi:NUP50 (nucleoporin 50 kDa) protein [Medicago truncatula]|uniref:NUP50 (Nucleoporin 50 kDa) protein n=1 Tax=Medicago truncatula TaxID=3880 RepID=G7L4G2_MEDTR|nr:NUP50 (nucleoporin 50 kDa) protein [Medicago truncatula]